MSAKTKLKGKQNNGLWETKRGNLWTRLWRNGKASWVSLGTTDIVIGKKKLAELQEENAPLPWNGTLADAAKGWLARLPNVRPNPRDQRLAGTRVTKYLLKHFSPDTRLAALDHAKIEKYRTWLDKQPIAPLTITHILSDLRALLSWCEETGKLGGRRSPFVSRKIMPKIQEKAPDDLTLDEIAALTSLPDAYGFTWRFLLATGCRWGEATRAQAAHVRDGQLEVEISKGKRVRRVPLGASILAELKDRVGLLVPFSANASGSFSRTSRKLSGCPDVHVHQARHTYAMSWLASGGSLAALQSILGHQDLETTQRYARVTDDLVRAEARRVEERRHEA